jgi:two-component system OmpR family response regulator
VSKKRIVLIEDDRSLQVALRYLLEDLGYDLVVAADREQAHAAITGGTFDAAIVDYFLDNVPSSDLIVLLRARAPAMPLICSTAAFAEQIELDESVRPDAMLYKPFAVGELRDTLNALIQADAA